MKSNIRPVIGPCFASFLTLETNPIAKEKAHKRPKKGKMWAKTLVFDINCIKKDLIAIVSSHYFLDVFAQLF